MSGSPADSETPESSALVAVGSNLGNREGHVKRGLELLSAERGVRIVAVSALIETAPVGGPPQGNYLNGALEVRTRIRPHDLLQLLHKVEAKLGRVRSVPDAPRELDLDLLLYDDRILAERGLVVPHPRMLERAFVLEPLASIAPARVHPGTGRTILAHWQALVRRTGGATVGGRGA